MKIHHSDDETGVTFSDRDKDVIRAGAKAVDSLLTLAEAVGFTGRDTCSQCGATAQTRPMRLFDDDGNEVTAEVCADCQDKLVGIDESDGDPLADLETEPGAFDPDDPPTWPDDLKDEVEVETLPEDVREALENE